MKRLTGLLALVAILIVAFGDDLTRLRYALEDRAEAAGPTVCLTIAIVLLCLMAATGLLLAKEFETR